VPATRLGVGPGGVPGSPSQGLINLAATPLPQAPEYTYALTANFEQDLTADLRFNSTVQFSYVDDVVLRSQGIAPDIQKGYGLLDGSIGFGWRGISLQLIGKNLLDKEYRVTSLPNVLFQGWGNPRTVLMEVSAQF
jgi:outer membrane receptor for ferric coprogen and ferric-rhodotorulic acid